MNNFGSSTAFPPHIFNNAVIENQQDDWPLFDSIRMPALPPDYYDSYSYIPEAGYINPMALIPPPSPPYSSSAMDSGSSSPEMTRPTTEEYTKHARPMRQSTRRPSHSKQNSTSQTAKKSKCGLTSVAPNKIAHNLVERKYRDTLNAELERLRQAVPHMAALGERASKAAILASAVAYIARLEQELVRLGKEVEHEEESKSRGDRVERAVFDLCQRC